MVKYENGGVVRLWLTSFEVGLVQCGVFALFLVITGHQFAGEQSENHRTDHYPSLRQHLGESARPRWRSTNQEIQK